MAKTLQAVRGMRDLLPPDTGRWQQVEATVRDALAAFGYEELRLPLLEFTELFARGVGEATDIVEKEMYTFADRGGDSLTLRPEGTAGVVRAALEHGLLHNQVQRLWYAGPMFRYERPQKGRYRQFDQIGAEVFGIATPDVDVELLQLTAGLWERLGVAEHVQLELNTLGDADSRTRYREALVSYLERHRDALDADSLRRLGTNPLRVLDSKDPGTRAVLGDAPAMTDFLDDDAAEHFAGVQRLLGELGIAYRVNPSIVRGLDYYNRTVFEWVTDSLGAQGTVCAGGRYDGLVGQLGGRDTPGVGFAMGVDRLVLLQDAVAAQDAPAAADAYVAVLSPSCQGHAMRLADELRSRVPGARVRVHLGGGKLKNQMKRADQSGAVLALVVGEEEVASGTVGVKPLREQRDQQQLDTNATAAALAAAIAARHTGAERT